MYAECELMIRRCLFLYIRMHPYVNFLLLPRIWV